MTLRWFIGELRVALGETIDDSLLSDRALVYYVSLCLNKVKEQEIARALRRNDSTQLQSYVHTFQNIPVLEDAVRDRRYVTLPTNVYGVRNGRGVDFVAYYRIGLGANCPPEVARVQFDATTWRELLDLYQSKDPIRMPSAVRPRYIQEDGRLYLFGMEPQVKSLELGLLSSFDPATGLGMDEEVPVSPETLFDIRRMVLSLGSWVLLQPNERLLNDGRDWAVGERKPPAGPAISVNDPIMVTPTSE